MNINQLNEKISSKKTYMVLKGKHEPVSSIEEAKTKYNGYINGSEVTTSELKKLDGNIMQGENLVAYFKNDKIYDSNHRIVYETKKEA